MKSGYYWAKLRPPFAPGVFMDWQIVFVNGWNVVESNHTRARSPSSYEFESVTPLVPEKSIRSQRKRPDDSAGTNFCHEPNVVYSNYEDGIPWHLSSLDEVDATTASGRSILGLVRDIEWSSAAEDPVMHFKILRRASSSEKSAMHDPLPAKPRLWSTIRQNDTISVPSTELVKKDPREQEIADLKRGLVEQMGYKRHNYELLTRIGYALFEIDEILQKTLSSPSTRISPAGLEILSKIQIVIRNLSSIAQERRL